MKELIRLENITKSFEDTDVLRGIDLAINENEFVTILGPSGCGKTTMLRIIGGFESPDSGKVLFQGRDITNLPANKRPLNTVFQNYALFPHMNVFDNIAFGLRVSNTPEDEVEERVRGALKMVNLSGYEKRTIDRRSAAEGGHGKSYSEQAEAPSSGRTSGGPGSETETGNAVRTGEPET